MGREEELEKLKNLSPYALPDNPSSSGWTTGQIKEKFYQGLLYLYDLLETFRTSETQLSSELKVTSDTLVADVQTLRKQIEDIIGGELVVTIATDVDGNVIKTTYAKTNDIKNGTIPAYSFIRPNGTVGNIHELASTLTSVTTQLQELASKVNKNGQTAVEYAEKDSQGNVIHTTYATKNELMEQVEDLTNGVQELLLGLLPSYVTKDEYNTKVNSLDSAIENTYTKSQVDSKISVVNTSIRNLEAKINSNYKLLFVPYNMTFEYSDEYGIFEYGKFDFDYEQLFVKTLGFETGQNEKDKWEINELNKEGEYLNIIAYGDRNFEILNNSIYQDYLKDFGQGFNKECYNYIDFENIQYHRKCFLANVGTKGLDLLDNFELHTTTNGIPYIKFTFPDFADYSDFYKVKHTTSTKTRTSGKAFFYYYGMDLSYVYSEIDSSLYNAIKLQQDQTNDLDIEKLIDMAENAGFGSDIDGVIDKYAMDLERDLLYIGNYEIIFYSDRIYKAVGKSPQETISQVLDILCSGIKENMYFLLEIDEEVINIDNDNKNISPYISTNNPIRIFYENSSDITYYTGNYNPSMYANLIRIVKEEND